MCACTPRQYAHAHTDRHKDTHTLTNTNDGTIQVYWSTPGWRRKPSQEWLPLGVNPHSPGSSVCWDQLSFPLKQLAADTDETPTQHTLGRALCHTQQIRKEGESEGAAHIPAVCHSCWSWRDREKDLVDGLLERAPVFLLCDRGPPLCGHCENLVVTPGCGMTSATWCVTYSSLNYYKIHTDPLLCDGWYAVFSAAQRGNDLKVTFRKVILQVSGAFESWYCWTDCFHSWKSVLKLVCLYCYRCDLLRQYLQ